MKYFNLFQSGFDQAMKIGYCAKFIDSDGLRTPVEQAGDARDLIVDEEICAILFENKSEKIRFSIVWANEVSDTLVQDYTNSDDKKHPINLLFGEYLRKATDEE